MKGVLFLSKRVYKRIKGETLGGGGAGGKEPPCIKHVEYPPGIIHTETISFITFLFFVLRFLLTGIPK